MGTGILICGLNGAGKSTLGKALAEKLDFYFIDIEDLYFPKTDPHYLYTAPRTRRQVEDLLVKEIREHANFVLSSVKGDYGETVLKSFQYVVLIEIPRELRLQRVRERSFEKFGDRILPGGDLYEKEERFFHMVEAREENMVEEWLKTVGCPVIRVDGTRKVEENMESLGWKRWCLSNQG